MSYERDSDDGKQTVKDIWGVVYQDLVTIWMWENRERLVKCVFVESTDTWSAAWENVDALDTFANS